MIMNRGEGEGVCRCRCKDGYLIKRLSKHVSVVVLLNQACVIMYVNWMLRVAPFGIINVNKQTLVLAQEICGRWQVGMWLVVGGW